MNIRIILLSALSFSICASSLIASTEGLNQEAYLKAIDVGTDFFGEAVAVSGRFAVVGATGEDSGGRGVNTIPDETGTNSGAAYVYERIDGEWVFHSFLKSSNSDPGDLFGSAVALDGDLLAVSALREGSNADGINGDESNNDAPDSGAVYLFRFNGTTWEQEAYLKASNADTKDDFGANLALDGNTLVVGAADDTGSNTATGSAYVFVYSDGNWTEQARLNAAQYGNGDDFGAAVAIDGDIIVVGAPFEDGSSAGVNGPVTGDGNNAGAAYVFSRSGETWTEIAYLKASNPDPEDHFGSTVTISGSTIAVGAVNERGSVGGIDPVSNNDVLRTGAVYVFADNGSGWEPQATIKAAFPAFNDEFGNTVVLSGDLLVVGSHEESGISTGLDGDETTDGNAGSGAVYLFTRNGSTWIQDRYVKASNAGSGDAFGRAIALYSEEAGDLLLVGAAAEDGNSPGVNGADNNLGPNAGAAYAFSIPRPVIEVTLGTSILESRAGSLSLGRVALGKKSRVKRFTIGNKGWADLNGLRVTATGKQRREFKLTQPALKTLAPSGSTNFSLTFRPRAKGARKATLLIGSNDPATNPFVLSVKGKGLNP